MPRTRRYIFNTLTVVSLLLMLATAGLWVDSYWFHRGTLFAVNEGPLIWSYRGQCSIGYLFVETAPIREAEFVALGIKVSKTSGPEMLPNHWWNIYRMVAPHWFLTLIFATLPAIWLFKWNKRRKLSPNACTGCGYDLTGNESGACPECGASAETSSDSA